MLAAERCGRGALAALIAAMMLGGAGPAAAADEAIPPAPAAANPPATSEPSPATAPDAPRTPGQELFREGKRLMDEREYEEGCPKLAQSFHLEPETGTLLTTALCYERAGRFASALAAYKDAVTRSRGEGRADRVAAAEAKASEIEPKVTKLVVEVKAKARLPGLTVTRDGVPLSEDAWGLPFPVDPGDHWVEARAPGKQPFTAHEIAAGPGVIVIQVPELFAPTAQVGPEGFWTPLRKVSLIVGGVGVAALGVGGYFGAQALSLKSDSQKDCDADVCGDRGFRDRTDARKAGNVSTAFMLTGTLLVAGGVTLFAVGAPDETEQVSLSPLPGGGLLGLTGAF